MDEREKLRKFRELDDAFAQALQQLDDPNHRLDIPTGPPVASAQSQRKQENERRFEERLEALMQEYHFAPEAVVALLDSLAEPPSAG
ncbi:MULTISPECIES: hypothetical protein [Halomonadaceae]|uniref:hypothetical protein n=1 Tax=Halomonas TaxID=2745 RepID=UPI001E61C926|nr:hypothetical protein [Halomonas sp. 328]